MYLQSSAKSQTRMTPAYLKAILLMLLAGLLLLAYVPIVNAAALAPVEDATIDRVEVVTQQIRLLKSRYAQSERQLETLQNKEVHLPVATIELASSGLLDKAALDISVYKLNLESINIELDDARQTVSLLEKNIQEINNQLNVLSIFGSRIARTELLNANQLRSDLEYQQRLVKLERDRAKYLKNLQTDNNSILQLKQDYLSKLNSQLKSQRMMRMKQQEVKDELAYQEKQNQWLQRLNALYMRLEKIDLVESRTEYEQIERQIFVTNEEANYAYAQSLIARYQDQIQQMNMIVLKSSSIAQLHEISDQVDTLEKQLSRLDSVLDSRVKVMGQQINLAGDTLNNTKQSNVYMTDLKRLQKNYKQASVLLGKLDKGLSEFRSSLSAALQQELAARQGLPTFGLKILVDLGKEILLVPALTFRVIKSLVVHLIANVKAANAYVWSLFVLSQFLLAAVFVFAKRNTTRLLERPSEWRERINTKWLSLKWLDNHFVDTYILLSVVWTLFFFNVPIKNYMFFVYLAAAWFVFKGIMTIAHVSLVEVANDSSGNDMRLYRRLRWSILVGGTLTIAAVFIYQLPLIYELKTLADRLFLLFMMVVSLMLLRYWDVVPNLILSHMEKRHPYLEKSIRLLGVLIPLILLANSIIGLLGYVNLVMTVSTYEGLFLIVLVAYLVLRGLLTDAVELLSHVVIQYSSNGWLLTEALLKPLDRILRVTLFLSAGAVLFLLYGWNKQSPIVERINGLLHYEIAHLLNSSITPLSIIELIVVISFFYWTAKWTREFVYRSLSTRTRDMGIRNSMAILSQYCVVVLGIFLCLQVLGIDLRALAVVAGMFAFGMGLGLRDMANNFFCGFLILLERPLRVGDIIRVSESEGEVTNIGSRAVTILTWDHMELVVPNSEIFNKSFINLTAHDNVVRCVLNIKISRHDSPHQIRTIIQELMAKNESILTDPEPNIYLREMNEVLLNFELRYYVNLKQIRSRTIVASSLLTSVWDAFVLHGIKPPYPQQEVFLRNEAPKARVTQTRAEELASELEQSPELS